MGSQVKNLLEIVRNILDAWRENEHFPEPMLSGFAEENHSSCGFWRVLK